MDWTYLFTSFEGRISRQPFWIGVLILWVIQMVAAAVTFGLFGENLGNILFSVISLVMIYPSLAVGVKRWHDHDKSGWWMLILLIPLVGAIWYLVVCGFMRGTDGANRYRPDPLGGS
jgi:uncharacterized membrane protein YhaH (DUF805 family)